MWFVKYQEVPYVVRSIHLSDKTTVKSAKYGTWYIVLAIISVYYICQAANFP